MKAPAPRQRGHMCSLRHAGSPHSQARCPEGCDRPTAVQEHMAPGHGSLCVAPGRCCSTAGLGPQQDAYLPRSQSSRLETIFHAQKRRYGLRQLRPPLRGPWRTEGLTAPATRLQCRAALRVLHTSIDACRAPEGPSKPVLPQTHGEGKLTKAACSVGVQSGRSRDANPELPRTAPVT